MFSFILLFCNIFVNFCFVPFFFWFCNYRLLILFSTYLYIICMYFFSIFSQIIIVQSFNNLWVQYIKDLFEIYFKCISSYGKYFCFCFLFNKLQSLEAVEYSAWWNYILHCELVADVDWNFREILPKKYSHYVI